MRSQIEYAFFGLMKAERRHAEHLAESTGLKSATSIPPTGLLTEYEALSCHGGSTSST